MRSQKTFILGIPFNNLTKKSIFRLLKSRIESKRKAFVVTANPEICEYANRHPEYKKAINNATYVIPDGIGIILASKLMRRPLQERIAGFDLMLDLLNLADKKRLKVYLLGAKKETIRRATRNIAEKYPNLIISGFHHGYIDDEENEKILNEICQTQPDLVFVAKGYPRQELWIHNNLKKFQTGVFMGVGGSFDVLAGNIKRAPIIWRKLNLEWLYRLFKQPGRWRRVLKIFTFLLTVYIQCKKEKKEEKKKKTA